MTEYQPRMRAQRRTQARFPRAGVPGAQTMAPRPQTNTCPRGGCPSEVILILGSRKTPLANATVRLRARAMPCSGSGQEPIGTG
jgi:hypothetical protein